MITLIFLVSIFISYYSFTDTETQPFHSLVAAQMKFISIPAMCFGLVAAGWRLYLTDGGASWGSQSVVGCLFLSHKDNIFGSSDMQIFRIDSNLIKSVLKVFLTDRAHRGN